MDQQRFIQAEYQLRHRHDDGSWADMQEVPSHHDAAQHDPERAWGLRRIFRCRTCPETVTLVPGAEGDAVEER